MGTFIHLSGKTLEENEPMIKSYVEKFNQSEPYMFVLTGKNNNNYELLEKNADKVRLRRSVDTERIVYGLPTDDDPCAFVTAGELTCLEYKGKNETKTDYTLDISSSSSSSCGGNLERKNVSYITLGWKAKSDSKSMKVNFTFESTKLYVLIA